MNLSEYFIACQEAVRMSSQEIAKACNKKHKHICRDIRVMLEDLGLEPATLYYQVKKQGEISYEYRLTKSLVLELCSSYSAKLRYKIINRLLELELPTPAEMRLYQALAMVELERFQKRLACKQAEQQKQIIANRQAVEAIKDQLALRSNYVDGEVYA